MFEEPKPRPNFFQLDIWNCWGIPPLCKCILLEIYNITSNGKDCWITNATFSKKFGVAENTISIAINQLIHWGFLIKIPNKFFKRMLRIGNVFDFCPINKQFPPPEFCDRDNCLKPELMNITRKWS